MIGITGVSGKLGDKVAGMLSSLEIEAVHLARRPEAVFEYDYSTVRRMNYDKSPETVEALRGIDTLFMVSAREDKNRLQQQKDFIDVAAEAGVKQLVYTSFYQAAADAIFTAAREHYETEEYIRQKRLNYTFLRDNFYMDFFVDSCLRKKELRLPAGEGMVSAVFREEVAKVAAKVLEHPENYRDCILNLTGSEAYSMQDIAEAVAWTFEEYIPYVDESEEETREALKKQKLEPWQIDARISGFRSIKEGDNAGISEDVEEILHRPSLTLEDYLRKRVLKK